jgi:hypothetical protein
MVVVLFASGGPVLVLAGAVSVSGEGESGSVFGYVVLGLLLSGSELVLDTLLLHAGSLSPQLLDALDLEIWCWILGKLTATGARCWSLWRVGDASGVALSRLEEVW